MVEFIHIFPTSVRVGGRGRGSFFVDSVLKWIIRGLYCQLFEWMAIWNMNFVEEFGGYVFKLFIKFESRFDPIQSS